MASCVVSCLPAVYGAPAAEAAVLVIEQLQARTEGASSCCARRGTRLQHVPPRSAACCIRSAPSVEDCIQPILNIWSLAVCVDTLLPFLLLFSLLRRSLLFAH